MGKSRSPQSLRQQAINYLARREHSQYELQRKLSSKGWDIDQINTVIAELTAEQLQSDDRFIAGFIRNRIEAGYGPRLIQQELSRRGIKDIPDSLARENDMEWMTVLRRSWQKKFAGQFANDLKGRAVQIRFLLNRGFAPEQVYKFCRGLYEKDEQPAITS